MKLALHHPAAQAPQARLTRALVLVCLALLLLAQGLGLEHRVAHAGHGSQGSHGSHEAHETHHAPEAHPHADLHGAWGGQHEEGDAQCRLADALGVADAAAGPQWGGVAALLPARQARPACPAGIAVAAGRPY